jgi:hypothetical protein
METQYHRELSDRLAPSRGTVGLYRIVKQPEKNGKCYEHAKRHKRSAFVRTEGVGAAREAIAGNPRKPCDV